MKREQLVKTREAMDSAILDCLVENYEDLIPSLNLPDQMDRHVLAAAIRGRADIIVTANTKDFPSTELDRYSIQAVHPDDFICDLLNLSPEAVYNSVRSIRLRLSSPPRTVEEYLETLERNGLTVLVSQLRNFSQML